MSENTVSAKIGNITVNGTFIQGNHLSLELRSDTRNAAQNTHIGIIVQNLLNAEPRTDKKEFRITSIAEPQADQPGDPVLVTIKSDGNGVDIAAALPHVQAALDKLVDRARSQGAERTLKDYTDFGADHALGIKKESAGKVDLGKASAVTLKVSPDKKAITLDFEGVKDAATAATEYILLKLKEKGTVTADQQRPYSPTMAVKDRLIDGDAIAVITGAAEEFAALHRNMLPSQALTVLKSKGRRAESASAVEKLTADQFADALRNTFQGLDIAGDIAPGITTDRFVEMFRRHAETNLVNYPEASALRFALRKTAAECISPSNPNMDATNLQIRGYNIGMIFTGVATNLAETAGRPLKDGSGVSSPS